MNLLFVRRVNAKLLFNSLQPTDRAVHYSMFAELAFLADRSIELHCLYFFTVALIANLQWRSTSRCNISGYLFIKAPRSKFRRFYARRFKMANRSTRAMRKSRFRTRAITHVDGHTFREIELSRGMRRGVNRSFPRERQSFQAGSSALIERKILPVRLSETLIRSHSSINLRIGCMKYRADLNGKSITCIFSKMSRLINYS